MKLTERETKALEALCDTFVPSLAFEKDEDPALFSMGPLAAPAVPERIDAR